jgi:hypothetical protein
MDFHTKPDDIEKIKINELIGTLCEVKEELYNMISAIKKPITTSKEGKWYVNNFRQ